MSSVMVQQACPDGRIASVKLKVDHLPRQDAVLVAKLPVIFTVRRVGVVASLFYPKRFFILRSSACCHVLVAATLVGWLLSFGSVIMLDCNYF